MENPVRYPVVVNTTLYKKLTANTNISNQALAPSKTRFFLIVSSSNSLFFFFFFFFFLGKMDWFLITTEVDSFSALLSISPLSRPTIKKFFCSPLINVKRYNPSEIYTHPWQEQQALFSKKKQQTIVCYEFPTTIAGNSEFVLMKRLLYMIIEIIYKKKKPKPQFCTWSSDIDIF